MEGMKERVITDGGGEKITVKWDGGIFALVEEDRATRQPTKVMILNPREMMELVRFAGSLGGDGDAS